MSDGMKKYQKSYVMANAQSEVALLAGSTFNADVGSAKRSNWARWCLQYVNAWDSGTGCDTILHRWQQSGTVNLMILQYPEQIPILHRDDSGSYASSTTYVTGMAVTRASEELKKRIVRQAAKC